MDCRIEDKNGFSVIGKRIRVSTVNHENVKRIPEFWRESRKNGLIEDLFEFETGLEEKETEEACILGVCANMENDEFDYWIAIETDSETLDSHFEILEIPAATWAVFESGAKSEEIQAVWKHITTEFFQESDYKHANCPDIEVYPDEEDKCEIWVPIEEN